MYDVIVVGSGTSGSFVAHSLTEPGLDCLVLEAGSFHAREDYPESHLGTMTDLYWAGGLELNEEATMGFLRPKCVGGGSVVNQALLDRFDDVALDSWRRTSGVEWFARDEFDRWYERAESKLHLEEIPEEYENRNAKIFKEGCEANGYDYHRLRRAQRDCRFEDGNDCIECLSGCPLDSKQSTPVTVLADALGDGLSLVSEFEVTSVGEDDDGVTVVGEHADGSAQQFRGRRLVLAAGAIGNSQLLLRSGFDADLPAVGEGFYTHPQCLSFGLYDDPVEAYRGPFQAVSSIDPEFRRAGFKLESVFAPPSDVALLLSGMGADHQRLLKRYDHLAGIEVAVRDQTPGRIELDGDGNPVVHKPMDDEDRRRLSKGLDAVRSIFEATGAREVHAGRPYFGLHLMGGCAMGVDPATSVVGPEFRLHGSDRIYAADSSVFPNAPGINPALTIMALSLKAADRISEVAA